MEIMRLLVVHILIGTSVALGMALVPTIAWLVQRLSASIASSSVESSGRSADWNSRVGHAHVGLTARRSTSRP